MSEERFESVEIPFETIGNRQVLHSYQILDEPWLWDFIQRFPRCFEYSVNMDGYYFWPEGDSPRPAEKYP